MINFSSVLNTSPVPRKVITLNLKSVDIEIDRLSEEQEKYLKHWKS